MSSSESESIDSDLSLVSEDDLEVEGASNEHENVEVDINRFAYSEEPLADEEWILEYNKREKEAEELEEELLKRLDGSTPVREWCKCKGCDIKYAQNLSETYCCKELDGCVESLVKDEVLEDITNDTTLQCVTEHPGFGPVCLQKWSLRLAADKYRKKNKETYRQTGSEESFLRSVAYREFTRLIYGLLGKNKRYPLPCCAYSQIRKTFKGEESDAFVGFELEEME